TEQPRWSHACHGRGAGLCLLRVLRVSVLRPGRKSAVGKAAPFAAKSLWRGCFTDCRGRIVGAQPSGERLLSARRQSARRSHGLEDGPLIAPARMVNSRAM